MKILWVKTDFLHPVTKGGHIRTLEMLKRLHRRHEIHYVACDDPSRPEGILRSSEYCSFAYPVEYRVTPKPSLRFLGELAAGLVSPTPVVIARYRSPAMKRKVAELLAAQSFDRLVCDFLFPSPNIPDLSHAILFEHNVESMIWRRHSEHANDWPRKMYFRLQAERMLAYERSACRAAGCVVSVSEKDADFTRDEFGVASSFSIPTGVDTEFFSPPNESSPPHASDLVFVGSMDWMPNIDGVRWFVEEVLPLIRNHIPDTKVCIVGRDPAREIQDLHAATKGIMVTGTVSDTRPYLWNSSVSIVPLRIGSGTRLKIYEAMATGTSVVSTTVGAEGLPVHNEEHLLLADTAGTFAAACVTLLESAEKRRKMALRARELVTASFSWESVARAFEAILDRAPKAS